MGTLELQIFVSLMVVLGAAFVALVCDYLKGNNERLREANLELQVRRQEEHKREQWLERTQKQAAETAALSQLEIQKAWSQRAAAPRVARPVASSAVADPRVAERSRPGGGRAEPVEALARE